MYPVSVIERIAMLHQPWLGDCGPVSFGGVVHCTYCGTGCWLAVYVTGQLIVLLLGAVVIQYLKVK
jgi:hypothetical protein